LILLESLTLRQVDKDVEANHGSSKIEEQLYITSEINGHVKYNSSERKAQLEVLKKSKIDNIYIQVIYK